jgi:uncharacterized membrane protein
MARQQGRLVSGPGEHDGEQVAPGLGWFSIGLGVAQLAAPGWICRLIGVRPTDDACTLQRVIGVREVMAGVGIFNDPRTERWLWARVVGDMMDLALLGMAFGSRKAHTGRVAMATASVLGVTAADAYAASAASRRRTRTGRSTRTKQLPTTRTVVVNRPVEEVYQFWRNFENFPRFMMHLKDVRTVGSGRSHWVAMGPGGTSVEWDAEVTQERPNELIAWRSLPGADVENEGSVRFERAPGGRGTLIRVNLRYAPPGGALGKALAVVMNTEPGQQVADDLRRFKQLLETGEVVRSDASIHLMPHPARPPERPIPFEPAYQASASTRPAVRSEAPAAAWASDDTSASDSTETSAATGSRGGAR